jgi:STIV B116-like
VIRLLNAAVMPVPGTYRLAPMTPEQFAAALRAGGWTSYVGYPEASRLLEELSGVPIPLNRGSTPVDDGDTLLIARLRYRVGNPATKGQFKAEIADYEFFKCEFSA